MPLDRIACCVPGCRRTRKLEGALEWPDDLWICQKHWAAVPVDMKTVKRRARNGLKLAKDKDFKFGAAYLEGRLRDVPSNFSGMAMARYLRVASRVTKEALNRAVGLR